MSLCRLLNRPTIHGADLTSSFRLAQNESPHTDIVLCGHSMGGILASEVALLRDPGISPKHNILGTISFDTPFLGMHPGIIAAGISSLFSTNHTPAKTPLSSTENTGLPFSSPQSQAYFNTAFSNDVRLPTRSGWANALNFISGNAKNLKSATLQLVSSYADFGSCLADYDGLRERYKRIRILEEEEEDVRRSVIKTRQVPRIRFVNYYTVSTGRIKRKAGPGSEAALDGAASRTANASTTSLGNSDGAFETPSIIHDTAISYDRPSTLHISSSSTSSSSSYESATDMAATQPETPSAMDVSPLIPSTPITQPVPIPPQPPVPPPLRSQNDVCAYSRALKVYEQDMKAYRKLIKLLAKSLPSNDVDTKSTKAAERTTGQGVTSRQRSRRTEEAQSMTKPTALTARQPSTLHVNNSTASSSVPGDKSGKAQNVQEKKKKMKRERTFCVLPPADKNDIRDPCWVKVHMAGVDEVGAHCGLFIPQDASILDDRTELNPGKSNMSADGSGVNNTVSDAELQVVDAVTTAFTMASTPKTYAVRDEVPRVHTAVDEEEHAVTHSLSDINLNRATPPQLATSTSSQADEEQQWSARYADLIQDVSTRIESWVHEAMTERLVRLFESDAL